MNVNDLYYLIKLKIKFSNQHFRLVGFLSIFYYKIFNPLQKIDTILKFKRQLLLRTVFVSEAAEFLSPIKIAFNLHLLKQQINLTTIFTS